MQQSISFLIPSFNTAPYLKFCIETIKKNLPNHHEICVVDDGSQDGSKEYLLTLKDDPQIKVLIHEENKGIPYTYNDLVSIATNEIIIMIHTDIVIPKNFDVEALPYLEKYNFVTPYRCEPPLYPASNDKVHQDFGQTWDTFDEPGFESFAEFHKAMNKGMTQERTCFPWLTTKTVFNTVGGIDPLYARYMVDDDDFYLRVIRAGYSYVQPFDVLVYHFCSKSTKFKEKQQENHLKHWEDQGTRSVNNFLRKWHRNPGETYNQDNSINNFNRYNIVSRILNPKTYNDVKMMELMSDIVVYDKNDPVSDAIIKMYIEQEQINTSYNLKDKFYTEFVDSDFSDIEIKIDFNNVNRQILGNEMITLCRMVDYNLHHIGHEITTQSNFSVYISDKLNDIQRLKSLKTFAPPCLKN